MDRRDTTLIRPSEITSPELYLNRREVIGALGAAATIAALGTGPGSAAAAAAPPAPRFTRNARFSVGGPPTSVEDVTSYNNF